MVPRITAIPALLLLLLSQILPSTALYFFLDGSSPKCFFEELPKDTLVVGHFKTEEYNNDQNIWAENPQLSLQISVDETFDNDHRVVNQRGSGKGRFTFTAAESGEHRLCFTVTMTNGGHTGNGWLHMGQAQSGLRLHLDLAIGETSEIESKDKAKIDDIVQRVKDLNSRLQDIRREGVFQREREAEFRDQSESTNARVVRWALLQLIVLGFTCAWQLTHLRAFFIKQKLT